MLSLKVPSSRALELTELKVGTEIVTVPRSETTDITSGVSIDQLETIDQCGPNVTDFCRLALARFVILLVGENRPNYNMRVLVFSQN